MLLLVLKRMSSSIWMILSLLIGSIIAVALVSSIPVYTEGILQRMLTKDLESYQRESGKYPGSYSIDQSMRYGYELKDSTKVYNDIEKKMKEGLPGEYGLPVLASNHQVFTRLDVATVNLMGEDVTHYVDLGSMDGLEGHINITNGRIYEPQKDSSVIEVIATSQAMNDLNILLGKEYDLKCLFEGYEDYNYRVKVVGVFTPSDKSDLYWNKSLSEYSHALFMDTESFRNQFTAKESVPITQAGWYYAFDYRQIKVEDMSDISDTFQKQADWIKRNYSSSLTIEMPANAIIDQYGARSAQLKTILWVLTVPVLIMLLFYISMVARLIIMHDENSIAVLKSRGAGKMQIFFSYLLESLIISIAALLAGPPLGMLLCRILGASNGFLEFVQRTTLPIHLNPSALLYSLGVIAAFMITMLVPAYMASNTTIVNFKQSMARKSKSPLWKKTFLDVLVLGTSIYGIYRYNSQQDILKKGVEASDLKIDPLLFLTSTLFILGAGLVFLRIYPYVVRLIYWLGKRFWSPVTYVSLIQVGRSRGQEQFLMIFIILSISTGLFSANSARTINKNIEDRIKYQTGADVTIQAVWNDNQKSMSSGSTEAPAQPKEPLRYIEPDYGRYSSISGLERTTKVFINDTVTAWGLSESVKNTKIMGIIPDEFARIAWFRNDLLPYHINEYLNLMTEAPMAFLVSTDLRDRLNLKEGEVIRVSWGEDNSIEGTVYAFIDYWPGYNPNVTESGKPQGLIVANFNYIMDKLPIQPYQVWGKKAADATDKQINDDIEAKKLYIQSVTYKEQQLIKAKNDPLLQGLNGSLTLSFIACMIISTLGFLIYWIVSIQSRVLYFGILRAMGLSRAKVIGIITCEQILVSGVAVVAGIALGGIASDLFIPILQLVYNAAQQVPPFKIIENRGDYIKIYSVVAVMLVVGFGTLWRIITKIRIDQALKLGED